MPKRYIISSVIGDGSQENPFRPKAADYNVNLVDEFGSDPLTGQPTTHAFCVVVGPNLAQLLADPDIDGLPDYHLDGKMNAMHTPTRNALEQILRRRGFGSVSDQLQNVDGYREVIRGVGRSINPHFDENNFDVSE